MFYFSTSLQLRMKIPTQTFRDVVLGCEAFWTLDHSTPSSVVFVSLGGMKCDRSTDGHIVDDDITLSDIASLKQNTMSIDCPPLLSAYWGGNIILSSHPLPTFWQKNLKKKLWVDSTNFSRSLSFRVAGNGVDTMQEVADAKAACCTMGDACDDGIELTDCVSDTD